MTSKRLSLLVLPFVILASATAGLSGVLFTAWPTEASIFLFLLAGVWCYTAKEATAIQTMSLWGEELASLPPQEKDQLSFRIAKDFTTFAIIHGVIFSGLYWAVIYVWSLLA